MSSSTDEKNRLVIVRLLKREWASERLNTHDMIQPDKKRPSPGMGILSR